MRRDGASTPARNDSISLAPGGFDIQSRTRSGARWLLVFPFFHVRRLWVVCPLAFGFSIRKRLEGGSSKERTHEKNDFVSAARRGFVLRRLLLRPMWALRSLLRPLWWWLLCSSAVCVSGSLLSATIGGVDVFDGARSVRMDLSPG
jgi:hypothetical protein